jgi:transcription initiation factor TFIID subunit TAF12
MTGLNILNNQLRQLMGKMDKIIEQQEKIIAQNEERERNPYYNFSYPYIPPVVPTVTPREGTVWYSNKTVPTRGAEAPAGTASGEGSDKEYQGEYSPWVGI